MNELKTPHPCFVPVRRSDQTETAPVDLGLPAADDTGQGPGPWRRLVQLYDRIVARMKRDD